MSQYMRKTLKRDIPRRLHSVRLADDQLEELNRIARSIKARPTNGTEASWRSLLMQIAEGVVVCQNTRFRSVFISYKKAPKWWNPDPDGAMELEFVLNKLRMTEQDAEDRGFEIKDDRIRAPWKAWKEKPSKKKKAEESPAPAVEFKVDPGCPPEWWNPPKGETNAMTLTAALKASGRTRAELVGAGFSVVGKMIYGLPSWDE